MTADEIKANLTKEQWRFYENIVGDYNCCDDDRKEWFKTTPLWHHKTTLEALAERNRLMKKHQWVKVNEFAEPYCIGCGRRKHRGCKPDCIWDAALQGVGE